MARLILARVPKFIRVQATNTMAASMDEIGTGSHFYRVVPINWV